MGCPATSLLALEKMLKEVRSVLDAIPTLDVAKRWAESSVGDNILETQPVIKFKMEKLEDWKEVSPATPEHKAQIAQFTKDVIVGEWQEILFSGAIRPIDKSAMIGRCDKLLREVKKARQRANQELVVDVKIAEKIFAAIM